MGADDYLAKPFSVLADCALKALFRRQEAMGQAQTDGRIQATA
jgi:DNA-binding response OmpR family regulator